jgi:acyl-coenzyme A thioesterase PaaI-like protein
MGIGIELRDGAALCKMPYKDTLIGNPMLPALHGGVTGAFLESAAMATLMVGLATPELPKIINITIEYLRPAGPRDSYASGTITRQGRRIANVSTQAWQDDRDTPFARAQAHFLTG